MILAMRGRDLPMPTLKEILKQAGLSEEQFPDLLQKSTWQGPLPFHEVVSEITGIKQRNHNDQAP
jgi:hypothetical protein